MRLAHQRSAAVHASLLACALLACGDNSGTGVDDRHLVLVGRLERGLVAQVIVMRGADTVTPATLVVSTQPADGATVSGNAVRFLRAGPLTITASDADGTVVTETTIATPPTIVFDALAGSNRDIYSVGLDGAPLTRLTTSPAEDGQPSATAGKIVFTSYRDGNAELYSMSAGGNDERRLTSTPYNETLPSLSPDGRSIAFVNDASGVARIWLASSDMTSASAATAPSFGYGGAIESSPAWSPVSDRVVFVSTATPSGNAGLFAIARTAGAAPSPVLGSGGQAAEVEPSWSPDGRSVAYASSVGGSAAIYVRDLATGAARRMTLDAAASGQPAWLPDGRLVFTTFSTAGTTLRWLDPSTPADIHAIPLPGLAPQHPASSRP